MKNTLNRIIKYASLAMIAIAVYSIFITPIFVYKFNIVNMPVYEQIIFYNDILMAVVGVMGFKLGENAAGSKLFPKLSACQAVASVACVATVYISNKMWTVGVFDIIYILSAVLSVSVFVCCIIARRAAQKASADDEA